MKSILSRSILALSLALSVPALSMAQTGPVSGPGGGSPGVVTPVGAARTLSAERLAQLVREAGMEVRSNTPTTTGGTIITAQMAKSGWTFVIEFDLSPRGEHVWIRSPLGNPLPDASALRPDALLRLLQANREHSPFFFQFNVGTRRVEMLLEGFAEKITADSLRRDLDDMCNKIIATHSLWDQNSLLVRPAGFGG